MFRYFAIGLSFAAMGLTTQVKAEISQDLVFCSKLKNGSERLACYDAAARLEKRGPAVTSLPRIAKAPELAVGRQSRAWDGAFVGIGAAAAAIKTNSNGTLTSNPGGDPTVTVGGETVSSLAGSAKGSGAGVDLRAGYLAQFSSLAIGVQADVLLPAMRAEQGFTVGPCSHPACVRSFNFPGQGLLSTNWVASALVKAGFVTPDNANLLYAVGGVSYADFSANVVSGVAFNNVFQFSFPHAGLTTNGWTAGLGWERRIADAWSLFAEYRISRFGNVDQRYSAVFGSCILSLTCTTATQMTGSLDLQSFRFGMNRAFSLAN